MSHTPDKRLAASRTLTHLLYALLIGSFCVWQLSRPGGPVYVLWAVQTLPLLILVPGMIDRRPRTYIWMCFILLLYFIDAVDGVFAPSRAWIDYVMLIASVTLFVSAMMTSRWMQRAQTDQVRYGAAAVEHSELQPQDNN